MRAAVALAFLAACEGRPDTGPPCEAVAMHFYTSGLVALDARELDGAVRRALLDQLPGWRDELARACREGGWSAAVRNCLANAADRAALDDCTRQLDDDQRAAFESWYTVRTH